MNTNSKRLGLYLAIVLLLTAAATSLRTIACMKMLDYETGFFTNKTLITIADVIIVVAVLGSLSYLLVAQRIKLRASFSTSATYVPTGVLAVATAFFAARVFSYASSISIYPVFPVTMSQMASIARFLGILTAILAFLSIAHHFLNAFLTESKAELRAYFAMATVMFLALYSMIIYLDPTLTIGDSSKVLRLITFIVSALFFLYEARISIGREMWRIYTAFGLASAALCAYTSIPGIITYYTSKNLISANNEYSLVSIEEYLLILALFIFIVARLCVALSIREEKENELIKALADYAENREQKVDESFSRYQEIFASKQLSIFDLYGGEITTESEEEEPVEAEAPEEEIKEPTISDEAIYESIFGKMPENHSETDENVEEQKDDRVPEEIANELLNALEAAMNDAENDQKET